ncbi:hypothetical protein [Fusibacter sp. JL216-2]|uniref:hypothetical protein n=1 Tax=Fusibacter sp. JL216-2 TaxID=3071453 RepID=UPI003D32A836
MEYEVRFYYPKGKVNTILGVLDSIEELVRSSRMYEKTIQYNHCDKRFDFYDQSVDGRFRLRVSESSEFSKCKLSWKRRIKDTFDTNVNKEEEVELGIEYSEKDNLKFLIEEVMHFDIIESYERYRSVYSNEHIEISVDEYPFGIALEIENVSSVLDPENNIEEWVKKLELKIEDAYRLSWDDKYIELCNAQGVEIFTEVLFDKPMPEVL